MYECSEARMQDKISTMSKFGDAGHGGITRYSLSPEALQARGEFIRRMEAIGAEIKTDDVACVYATLKGSDPFLKNIVMASHCYSVKNGGNYDGILGVMGAMEVLETIAAENIPHKHDITAMICLTVSADTIVYHTKDTGYDTDIISCCFQDRSLLDMKFKHRFVFLRIQTVFDITFVTGCV